MVGKNEGVKNFREYFDIWQLVSDVFKSAKRRATVPDSTLLEAESFSNKI